MKKLLDIVKAIISFPEIYIGKPSVERLYAFLGGFLYQNSENDDHCLDGFNEYIAKQYHIRSDHNWAEIIQFFSSCEKEAFEQFTVHFLEYTKNVE